MSGKQDLTRQEEFKRATAGVLRAIALVETETHGQKRVYRLAQPDLALWLIDGIDFIAHRLSRATPGDIEQAKKMWHAEAMETMI